MWRVKLPANLDPARDPILRFHYVGDVARISAGDRLLVDDFYNGNAFEFGLRRHAADLKGSELRFAVLPLQKNAPIYLPESARRDFGADASIATLTRVELVQTATITLAARPEVQPVLPANFRNDALLPSRDF